MRTTPVSVFQRAMWLTLYNVERQLISQWYIVQPYSYPHLRGITVWAHSAYKIYCNRAVKAWLTLRISAVSTWSFHLCGRMGGAPSGLSRVPPLLLSPFFGLVLNTTVTSLIVWLGCVSMQCMAPPGQVTICLTPHSRRFTVAFKL